ncbi:6-hydroxy-D-nicotine oxidase [Fusarium subglutinans]|uniref:6-hydroxy-D-nicotine oxidase n=1 Tax=Gibberella subglutinans TaxID=42677 RepID=A0A8H5V7R9_GIBSU|nr:6-hydroxy-D-nicotine oxidase [Fusarium subglutinans]KAF5611930.1 6-hydroxy-D-nicotine oxidase [Fusarium subglutinans]
MASQRPGLPQMTEEEKERQRRLLELCMQQVGFFRGKKIPVYTPGELEYEKSVANSNLLYRFERPGCVTQPEHESHVRIIVKRAKEVGLPIRVKNGGHSYAGFSAINNGISIDLVNMKRVDLDKDNMTITMEAGALWAHAYHELINDHHDKLVINGGRCPSVGVSGFTLGGGLAPFTRSFGLGSDTLLEVRIVTADHESIKVSPKDKKSEKADLFWALCGAGGNNFGVVTELKMKVQELHHDYVVAGVYTWAPAHDAASQMAFEEAMIKFYSADWSNEMTIDTSWLMDLKDTREDPSVRFLVYYNGLEKDFDKEVDEKLGNCGKVNDKDKPDDTDKVDSKDKVSDKNKSLAQQLKDRTLPENSTLFLHETLVAQWSEETQKALPSNAMFRIYTSFSFTKATVKQNISEITKTLKKHLVAFKEDFKGEEGSIRVSWIHSGGEASKKSPDYSAYPWRACEYHTYIMIEWKDKWLETKMRGVLTDLNKELRKYSMDGLGVYINFPDATLDKDTYEKAYYGDNWEKLQSIKAHWDKDNIFQWPHGVQVGPHVDSEGTTMEFASPPLPPSSRPVVKGFANAGDAAGASVGKTWDTCNLASGSPIVGLGN